MYTYVDISHLANSCREDSTSLNLCLSRELFERAIAVFPIPSAGTHVGYSGTACCARDKSYIGSREKVYSVFENGYSRWPV